MENLKIVIGVPMEAEKQPWSTNETKIVIDGYRQFTVTIIAQENAFMTWVLFDRWINKVIFPSVDERRSHFPDTRRAFVLMDGLRAHQMDAFLHNRREKDVDVVSFMVHSFDQCEPLDLLTFALLKRPFSSLAFDRLKNPRSNKVVRMLGAFFAAIIPSLTIEAFMQFGLIPYLAVRRILLRVDRALTARVRRAGDTQPDTPALLGPDAHKGMELPGRRTQKPRETENRQEALPAEKTSSAFVLFVIKAFA
jgi:hypothetical protein